MDQRPFPYARRIRDLEDAVAVLRSQLEVVQGRLETQSTVLRRLVEVTEPRSDAAAVDDE